MEFQLTDKILRRICEVNQFEVRKNEMIFFGLRGALPADVEDYNFKKVINLFLLILII